MRTHYDNLKVARNAPQEVIRAAYKSLSQKYHPDRNNNSEESIRIMKLINESYEILSVPEKRNKHDQWIYEQENGKTSTKINQDTIVETDFPALKSGFCFYTDLDEKERKKLIDRVQRKNLNQFSIPLDGVKWNYFWCIVLFGWFFYLFSDAVEYKWPDDTFHWYLAFTSLTAVLLGININWIYQWHKTPLQSWLFVTPVHIIKTHLDKVWFWPIWTVSDIKATHNYRNGSYQGTLLVIAFDGKQESFSISPQSAYESLLNALKKYDGIFRQAVKSDNISYFIENDDFINLRKNGSSESGKNKIKKSTFAVYGTTFFTAAILFVFAGVLNSSEPDKPIFHSPPEPKYNQSPKTKPGHMKPATAPDGSPWPIQAGYVQGYDKLNTDGLSSVTVDNSQNDSDVFVKLVKIDASEAYPIRVFYIPSHGKFKVSNISQGKYDIRYKDLDSGGISKSESFDLEETGTYDGKNYSEISLTLYKVRNGNMQTYGISESEF